MHELYDTQDILAREEITHDFGSPITGTKFKQFDPNDTGSRANLSKLEKIKKKKKYIKRSGSASGMNKSGDYAASSKGGQRRLKTKTPMAQNFDKNNGVVVGVSAVLNKTDL